MPRNLIISLCVLSALIAVSGCRGLVMPWDRQEVVTSGSWTEDIEKVAVVVDAASGVSNRDYVETGMEGAVRNKGYVPINRTHLESLIDEQDLQRVSELTEKDYRVAAGQIANVQALLYTSVTQARDVDGNSASATLVTKLIRVSDGQVLWTARGALKAIGDYTDALNEMIKEIEEKIPPKGVPSATPAATN